MRTRCLCAQFMFLLDGKVKCEVWFVDATKEVRVHYGLAPSVTIDNARELYKPCVTHAKRAIERVLGKKMTTLSSQEQARKSPIKKPKT